MSRYDLSYIIKKLTKKYSKYPGNTCGVHNVEKADEQVA